MAAATLVYRIVPLTAHLRSRIRHDTGVCGTANLPRPDGYGVIQGKLMRTQAVDMSVPFAAGPLCSNASGLVRWSHLLATGRVLLPASLSA